MTTEREELDTLGKLNSVLTRLVSTKDWPQWTDDDFEAVSNARNLIDKKISAALQAKEEEPAGWIMELAKEMKANAEDHPQDYISKFVLGWADQLACRAVAANAASAGNVTDVMVERALINYTEAIGGSAASLRDPQQQTATETRFAAMRAALQAALGSSGVDGVVVPRDVVEVALQFIDTKPWSGARAADALRAALASAPSGEKAA